MKKIETSRIIPRILAGVAGEMVVLFIELGKEEGRADLGEPLVLFSTRGHVFGMTSKRPCGNVR